ncbi:MAG: hypothetical protein AB1817_17385, partial [Chloroflexota bacterium]
SKLAALRRDIFARRDRDVCAECNACPVSERHPSRQRVSALPDLARLESLVEDEVRRAIQNS